MIAYFDPRTGQKDGDISPPSDAELDALAARLRAGQRAWAARSIESRAEALLSLRASLERHGDAIASALERDTGRRATSQRELAGVLASIAGWGARAPGLIEAPWTAGRAMPHIRHAPQFVPYTLVGCIAPWNFPLTLSLIDAVPALLAGCAVLLKPSEVTPRFAGPLRDAIADAGLEDVFGIVLGDGATGAALIERVDAVCFTGSVATGRKVAHACAARLIPAFLELGGKDPLIVLASAPLEGAVTAALRGSVLATGQACQSIERIYVARPLYSAFVQELARRAAAAQLNWPDIAHGDIGPFIFGRQADIVAAQIADAKAKGARVVAGGEIEHHGGGRWLRPTVLVDVDHTMAVMRDETFGPVMPVMAFDTIDEAVGLANDTTFGLSAAVFAGTIEEAEAVGRRLDAGAVSLNDAALTAVFHEAEKHAFGESGLGGSRMGAAGFHRFLRRKALIANTGAPAPLSAFAEDR